MGRKQWSGSHDIDNAYWEFNKHRVLEDVHTARALVNKGQRVRGMLNFSLAKGGCKAPDRVGESTVRNYRVLTLRDLLMFVEWDSNQNTLFELWGVALRLAKRGVLIGGFRGAQLMCLSARCAPNGPRVGTSFSEARSIAHFFLVLFTLLM